MPTEAFVRDAQHWYYETLLESLQPEQLPAFVSFESRLLADFSGQVQAQLILQHRLLDWLLYRVPANTVDQRMYGKLRALRQRLNWRLAPSDDPKHLLELVPYAVDSRMRQRLKVVDATLKAMATQRFPTTNDGQAYINECASWDVPIPPSIGVLDPTGTAGWRSLGFIPTNEQFIVGTPAEVRVFESSDGMCIALPRYTNGGLSTVRFDGVICLSQISSKVCFWDNQMNGSGFNFAAGDQIPIGVPNLSVDPLGRYQGGGAELEFGTGGVCTDCHAGENPYIIHPNSDLGGGLLMGDLDNAPLNLPTFGPDRYDPIVAGSWPQNDLSHSDPLVPPSCINCHSRGRIGGRFPHLSSELPMYCGTILNLAINGDTFIDATMPLGNPGSAAGTQEILDFLAYCGLAPTAGPSDRGDPHLLTVDGTSYDFQSAGEFTALRNSSTGFELQTRQTPVLTTFTPGPNSYTGLSSCVSLNTAVALRLGDHRVSFQPSITPKGAAETMVLYVDGLPQTVPSGGIDFGDGNRIAPVSSGDGFEFRAVDGTRVLVTNNYWASQGYSYLNIEVLDTPSREGILGAILGNDWLPRGPDGSSFGTLPADLATRDQRLNVDFANVWRVTTGSSLFEYAPGTSTADFTDPSWPPPNGTSCESITSNPWPGGGPRDPVTPLDREIAEAACAEIKPQEIFDECVFDVQATGNAQMADALALSLAVRNGPCATCTSSSSIFTNGFESGDLSGWSSSAP